ncbi:MAG: DMT family transporter, partial [Clostridiales bacterium]|nr:DMT family transporter [Clostridiales bacterium]
GTIVFSSIAFGKISVSAILAIGLFGQSITSIVIDQYGIFGMPKTIFAKKKFFGLAFVILGIMIMLDWFKASAMIPVVVSLLAGVTIVINRTTNARLALETSVVKSTLYNHVVGFFVAIVFMIILGRGETIFTAFRIVPNVLLYTGGLVGVLVVTLLNITVARVSSFYMTLLVFIGQVFAGIVFDTILTQSFSMTNLIGGMLVAIGLSINVWIDKWDRKTLVTISE